MKVVVNRCFGGFGISHEATMRYIELSGQDIRPSGAKNKVFRDYDYYVGGIEDDDHYWWDKRIERTDPALVQVVEEMGEKANSRFSQLVVVDIPDDVEWTLEEYDGNEWIAEKHRTWP